MKYATARDREWIAPVMTGYKMACCDCGLIHVVNFEVDEDGQVWIQPTRDRRATAARRRGKKTKAKIAQLNAKA